MPGAAIGALQLADWRRSVAEIYARWRAECVADPEAATARWRSDRDALLRDHPQSPLPAQRRAGFGGLPYYPYDAAYRMVATVEPLPDADGRRDGLLQLPTSGQEPFSFRLIGHVALSGPLEGTTLPLFWMDSYAGGLFLPLRDATAGRETYSAGRYLLDTIKGADMGGEHTRRELVLDFNLAYHPSCAYDPRWNCPLAPPASRLALAVPAGERLAQ